MIPTVPAVLLPDGLLSPPVVSRGVSDEASQLRDQSQHVVRHMWESISVRDVVDSALSDLERARDEASSDGWDGRGSRALDQGAYWCAKQLILSLPSTIPPPTVSVDPDGEVDLAWDFDRHHVFSISVSRTGRLSYAGLLGTERHSGVAHFVDEIPGTISSLLSAYFSRLR
jgi:hypothetical protein